jgi:tetratricopeptide (TPR) repeat protein
VTRMLFTCCLFLVVPTLTYSSDTKPEPADEAMKRGLEALEKKEYDKAIASFTEAIRLDPKNAAAFFNRGVAHELKKEYDKAVEGFTEAIRLEPKEFMAYNELAWLLATCPKDKLRDGKKAVELATKSCELSKWKDASGLDVLAAAHAECGEFKEAVKWQKKAIEVGFDDKEMTEKARQRLKLYEEGKPYRED